MSPARCVYCGSTTAELRPYGPGGAPLCHLCMKATPEREAAAGAAFLALLDANEALSPTATTVLTSSGPAPFDARLIDPDAEVV